jgi:hypothetical protein
MIDHTWIRSLHRIRIGEPVRAGGVTAVPLFGEHPGAGAPLPLGAALAAGEALVEELATATVGQVRVSNRSPDYWVLGVGGELLCGGRQDRAINASFLLAPSRTAAVAVTCVERGRWQGRSRFESSHVMSNPAVRACLQSSVHADATRTGARRSDQGAVWAAVDRTQITALGGLSSTGALRRVYERNERAITERAGLFRPRDGQTGVALFVGATLATLDDFGCPSLFGHYFPLLVEGAVADAVAAESEEEAVEPPRAPWRSVSEILARVARCRVWSALPADGDGEEIRPVVPGYAVAAVCRAERAEHLNVLPAHIEPPLVVAEQAQGDSVLLEIRIDAGPRYFAGLRPGRFLVGRSSRCDLRIDAPSVSRRHAELEIHDDGELALTDLGSKYGTSVDEHPVKRCTLRPGERVVLGGSGEIRYHQARHGGPHAFVA